MKFLILFVFISFTTLFAENNTTIDRYHKIISTQVLYWSDYLDSKISSWILDDNNDTCEIQPFAAAPTSTEEIDSFFQNNRYLNDTRDVFIRLRTNSYFYTREPNKINMRISAQLPFDRCKKNFNLYFEEDDGLNNEIKTTDTFNSGVGIRYYGQERYGIKSSYSIGLTHASPYLRARYKYPLVFGSWRIEPIQTLQYSNKYYFDEETNIYFDKTIHEKDLFRVQLHRRSAYVLEGMDYGVSFQYYWNWGKDAGIELTQSFFGNTHYNDYYADDKDYKGINNYVTSIRWRENFWRKWLYYEIKPSVNFHKDNNFDPSYGIRFSLDIYFGKFD